MMELTRREHIAGLIGATTGASSALYLLDGASRSTSGLSDADIEALYATAEVVYPSVVDVSRDFVRAYSSRLGVERRRAVKRTVEDLNRRARQAFGKPFAAMPAARRDGLLRALGVNRVYPNPKGTLAGRVRFYLVNSLLFALFTNPIGSTLFGIENPVGHPGGFENLLENDTHEN